MPYVSTCNCMLEILESVYLLDGVVWRGIVEYGDDTPWIIDVDLVLLLCDVLEGVQTIWKIISSIHYKLT